MADDNGTPVVELQIKDNAEQAKSGLDGLVSSLRALGEAAKAASGLADVANSIQSFTDRLKNIDTGNAIGQVNALAGALNNLKAMSQVDIKVNATGDTSAVDNVANQLDTAMNTMNSGMVDLHGHIEELNEEFNNFTQGAENALNGAGQEARDAFGGAAQAMQSDVTETTSAIEETNNAVRGLGQETQTAFNSGAQGSQILENEMTSIGREVKNVTQGLDEAATNVKTLSDTAKNSTGALAGFRARLKELFTTTSTSSRHMGGLLSSFARIAKYRFIRTVLKEIAEGFTTGLKNVREYSKAIGSEFYRAMDSANVATLKMKNSIGAAFAPVLQALIPLLQTVVNWIITAANAFNQFISLLTGRGTWTRATDNVTDALDDMGKSAGGAGKEMKGLLAAWDELNIIQSQPGGGGGGGGALVAEDYALMFEEVNQFDSKIRQIVGWIRDNFDDILDVAKMIGAILLTWKLSTAFGGALKMLSALASIGVMVLEFKLSTIFTNNYLDTGEPGWLLADILTTALGALAAYKFMNVAGFKFGWVTIPLTLIVSATAGIIATLGNTDVSALSEENLIKTLEDSAKIGVAGGLALYKLTEMGALRSAGAGAGIALVTWGALVGLKAVFSTDVDLSQITSENAEALLLGAGLMGAGAGVVSKMFGASKGKAFGNAAVTAIATGLVMGAAVDLKAIFSGNVDTSELTAATARAAVMAAAAGGLLVFKGARALGISTMGKAGALAGGILGGIATGLFVTAVVGIKAMFDKAVDATELTSEMAVDTIKNALLLGGGVGALTKMLGFGALTALGAGAIGVIATGLVLYALVSAKVAINKSAIGWGDYSATEEEIKQFVNEQSFTVDVVPTLNLVSAKIDNVDNAEMLVGNALAEVKTTWDVIKLGVDSSDNYAELKKQIMGEDGKGGAIGAIQASITEKKALLTTTLSIVPVYSNGQDVTSETLMAGMTGLSDVSEYFSKIGSDIGKYLQKGIDGSLDDTGEKVLAKLMEEFNEASQAFSTGQIQGKAMAELTGKIAGMDQPSFEKYLAVFNETKDEIKEKLSAAYLESAETYRGLAAFYTVRGDEVNAARYTDMYNNIIENLKNGIVDATADNLAEPGKQAILEAMWQMIPTTYELPTDKLGKDLITKLVQDEGILSVEDIKRIWSNDGGPGAFIEDYIRQAIGMDQSTFELLKESGISIFNLVADDMVKQIKQDLVEKFYKGSPAINMETAQSMVEALFGGKTGRKSAIDPIDHTAFDTSLTETTSSLTSAVDTAEQQVGRWNRILRSMAGLNGGKFSLNIPQALNVEMLASGGVVTTGEMFIAREAGPEMVGRIGNHTAVANNDQIVAGVASGVASANAEQNAILMQQNQLLRQLLNKEFIAKAVPSSAWGRFNKESDDMYTRMTGRG